MHFQIITPMRTALETEVLGVHLPGAEGELEVLPGHANLITSVANGELVYRPVQGEPASLFVGGGFLQVDNNGILLVTDTALEADEINNDTVEEALRRAQDALRNESSVLDREEQTRLAAAIAQQMAMLEYSRKRRANKH